MAVSGCSLKSLQGALWGACLFLVSGRERDGCLFQDLVSDSSPSNARPRWLLLGELDAVEADGCCREGCPCCGGVPDRSSLLPRPHGPAAPLRGPAGCHNR